MLIDDDELADELHELVGAPFLDALRQRHDDYGRVLGITDAKADEPDAAGVVEPLRRLRSAIGSYVRAVVGLTDEDDPDSVAAITAQLRPLVDARRPRPSNGATDTAASEAVVEEAVDQPLPAAPMSA